MKIWSFCLAVALGAIMPAFLGACSDEDRGQSQGSATTEDAETIWSNSVDRFEALRSYRAVVTASGDASRWEVESDNGAYRIRFFATTDSSVSCGAEVYPALQESPSTECSEAPGREAC